MLGTPHEERFDRITRLAARLLDVPFAMVNLVADDHQWTKAGHGLAVQRTPLSDSICRYPVQSGVRLEVNDLTEDEPFRTNAFVVEDPHVRFYAGEPLSAGGTPVGTLCVLDTEPRELSDDQRALLAELAAWAEAELNNTALNHLVAELHDREHRLQRLVDAVPEGVFLVDEAGAARATNAVAERLFGLPHGRRVPLDTLLPGLSPDSPPFARRRRGDRTGVTRAEVTGRSADGHRFPLEVSVSPLEDAGDDRWLVLARDLSPREDAEAELRRQERLTSMILASAGDGIVGSDHAGVVVFANPAATRILGCRESDLVGKSLHAVAHHTRPDGSPFPQDECPTHRAITESQFVVVHTDLFWRRDGRPVPIEMSVAPIVSGDEVHGAVTTFRDISQRTEVERLKDEFISVVSHELRTPLTSIKGSLSLLTNGVMGPVPAAQQPLLDMARRNAERLGELVDDILDLDRLEAGRMPLRPVETDADELAAQVVGSLQPAAAVAGVELSVKPCGGGATVVRVDPHRMNQVLTNLVGNAIKFSSPGCPVTVSVSRAGDEVCLAVRDRGPGIPEDQHAAVFERFRQVHEPGGARTGTGLGLPIARGIVDRSGGRIELTSEPGKGSTFTVVLPAARETTGGDGG
ncbi:ATP-binding protein [Geodermatophilus obscurus]|uniref:histidine kinase n=1 Tax=Geodermatophilus obscurus (strain ATCC 25078 / DSM 43160 / JCM 3152 / CCUG 61914 / KCC A-0152 / KCTC 9177 / NBRC 13315 / NRRL B-3577 / G-20) TaxID=526225 RepID=D2SC78_GEOOG|nr:ATP-binding protein [Geodermatophilus obscurus]ADB74246.1 multi-sensor signal transduction histidine kinase [Geodermatophilus obscurus DSM 43160]